MSRRYSLALEAWVWRRSGEKYAQVFGEPTSTGNRTWLLAGSLGAFERRPGGTFGDSTMPH